MWIQNPRKIIDESKKIRAKKIDPTDIDSPWIGIHDDPVLKNTIIDNCDTLVDFIREHSQYFPNENPAIGYRHVLYEYFENDQDGRRIKKRKLSDHYQWISYGQMWERVTRIAHGLRLSGIDRREPVVILCETCAEFLMMQFALARAGLIQVNVYATLGESGIAHAIRETKARYMFTSWDLLPKVRSTIVNYDLNIEKIIYLRRRAQKVSQEILDNEKCFTEPIGHCDLIPFDRIELIGQCYADRNHSNEPNEELCQPLDKDELSLIVFTSGSTGLPKGVQLTSKQVIHSIPTAWSAVPELVADGTNQVLAGFLPQAHIFEAIVELAFLAFGGRIGFASPLTLVDGAPGLAPDTQSDLSILRPTIMMVAPLVLKRVQAQIYKKLEARSSIHVPLFDYLINYKLRWTHKGYNTPLLNRLVCSKISGLFGGNLAKVIAGGAPLSPRLQAFCRMAMNTNLVQGFGMTETCGPVLCMDRHDLSYGRSGPPLLNVYARLADWTEGGYRRTDSPCPRGELLIGSKTHWNGYLNLPKNTDEGYLKDEKNGIHYVRTGDIVQIHPDGTLEIIDRKKDLVKLANGEYVSLGKIESTLKNCNYIDHICVFGNGFANHLVGLIVPNKEKLNSLAVNGTKSMNRLKEMIWKLMQETGLKCGLKLVEIPLQIEIVLDEWTPDNEMLTAAMKLKRNAIKKRYHNVIADMFTINSNNGDSHGR